MIVLTQAWLLPTNTPAFQTYALHTAVTNAVAVAIELHLNPAYMSTDKMTYNFFPGPSGIAGNVTFGDRYSFGYNFGQFCYFADLAHENDTNMSGNHLTLKSAQRLAISTLETMGVPPSTHRGKPYDAHQVMAHSGTTPAVVFYGKPAPTPIYYFEWQATNSSVQISVSGAVSNVVCCRIRGVPILRMYYPSNYYEMMGLPKSPVFVRSLNSVTGGPPYEVVDIPK